MKALNSIRISGTEVLPLVEGGKGIAVSNGESSGAWAATGGVGTFSGVNADSYDEDGNIIPVVYQGRLYFFASGVATCNDAKTGKKVFLGRLEGGSSSGGGGRSRFGRGGGGSDYSSPVVADGKIYYVQSSGSCFVLKAGDKFEQLAVNSVTTDRESFGATPALSNGEIFLRSDKHLYCVSETAQK